MPAIAAMLRGSPGVRIERRAAMALDAGFEAVALGEPLAAREWEPLQAALPRRKVAALEAFLPSPTALRPGEPSPFAVASLDAETRRDSIAQAIETLRFADRHGIPALVLPPAGIDGLARDEVLALRRDAHFETRVARLRERRKPAAAAHLDSLLKLLARVLPVAERYETRIELTAGGFPDQFPGPGELEAARREFQGAPLGAWLDLEARARSIDLGFAAAGAWEPVVKAAEGAVFRDVPTGGKATRELAAGARLWVFDPPRWPAEEAELARAREALGDLARDEPEEEAGRRRSILEP